MKRLTNRSKTTRTARLLAAGTLVLAALAAATAAPRTWSGGGGDNNWGTAANWGGTVPGVGDSLIFQGITRITNFNNLTGLNLAGLSFNNSLFLFGGTTITNSGGIVDNAGNNTNNLPVYLSGSQGITNNVSGTVLQLGGLQTNLNSGNVITFGGPGNINVNGVMSGFATVNVNGDGGGNGLVRLAAANTFTGPVTVNSGTLQFANAAAIPTGNGKADLTLNSGTTLDLNGNSQTLNGLFGTGTVDNKTGGSLYTLTVGNSTTNLYTGGSAFEFSGIIQNTAGTVALAKVNTNIFTLDGGADTYAGNTTVSAGKLILGASATLPNTPNIFVSPGAQLDVSAQTALAIGGTQALYAGRNTNGGPGDILGSVDNSGRLVILNPAVAGTLNIANNLILEGGSTVTFDLGNNNTAGSGSNDLITINGTLTLNGGTIALNPYQGALATGVNGTYTLITNSQALESGSAANLTLAVPRGITPTLDDTTFPGSLLVHVAGSGVPVSLVWNGTSGATWDVQTSQSWLNGVTPDYFYFLDNVVFNDVGNGNVNVATGVSPSTTAFNNSATNAYILSGPGAISGSGTLSVNNNGVVTLNTPNNFTGNIFVNYGQILLGNYSTGSFVNNVVIYNSVAPGTVFLGNGGLYLVDQANTFITDTFNLVLNPGGSSLAMRNRQSNSTTYSYQIPGNPVRNVGGTLDLSNLQQRSGSTVGVYIPAAAAANGILGGYATVNLNDWVAPLNTGVGSGAYAAYQNNTTPSAWGTLSNIVLTANPVASLNSQTINSLKLTGPAAITITAGQTLTLSSGGLLVPNNAAGVSSIAGGSIAGSAAGDLVVLQNSLANALTISSTIADNGGATALTKAGLGTLILTGNNAYSGATFINGATVAGNANATPGVNAAGTLQVGAGGTSGSLGNSTAVTNYGTLAYNRSDNVTLGIPLNGPGALRQLGSGVLTLTGANTYSGPTTISAGTLQVGAGGTSGSLGSTSNITNNGALVFNRADALTLNGAVAGAGSLFQLGGGTLTLNNAETYAGLTVISNGTVTLGANGSLANSAGIVLSSGTTLNMNAVSGGLALTGGSVAQVLAGFGSVVGSVTATNNTVITPGTNSLVGTLAISGGLTVAGGTLRLDVGSSSKDLITVGGALALNSGAVVVNALNTLPNGSYKLIGYGSVSGATANLSFSGFSQAGQLAYLTNNAAASEIDLVVYSGSGAQLTWVGDGVNNFWDINVSPVWNNGTGAAVFHNNDDVTFNDSSANPGVALNAGDAPASVKINTLVNNYSFSGSGSLVGGGSVTVNATNSTVTIKAAFNNSGATVINTGTVQVGDGSTPGTLGIGAVTNNGTINFNEPADTVFSGSLAGAGSLFQQGATVLKLTGNNAAYTGPVTVSSGVLNIGGNTGSGSLGSGLVTNNGVLVVDRTGALNLNNNITGSGPVQFANTATVTYGGNNTYANNTYISNGVVKLGSSSAIPADGSAGSWLILDGGTSTAGVLDLNGNNATVNALQGINGPVNGIIRNNVASTTSKLTVVGSAATGYSGSIVDNSGAGGKVQLVMLGSGVQTLDVESVGGNTYSGGTVISNGTLAVSTSNANGTTANYPNANAAAFGSGPITFLGTNGILSLAGSIPQGNGPTFNPGPLNTVIIPANQSGTVNPPQRGGTAFNLTGSGTLSYIASYVRGSMGGDWSAFTGQVIFTATNNGGNLGIDSSTGIPNGHVLFTNVLGYGVNLYNRVAGTPTIPYGEIAGDAAHQISGTEAGNNNGALAANFAVGSLNTSTNFDGAIIDNVGIIKVGTGVWTLNSATLTYTGPTTVSNGVLVLGASGALPNSTPITLTSPGILDVSAAGTLTLAAQTIQGNGTLRGSLATVSGTTVSPGGVNSIGVLTITNDVNLAGTTIMELNRTNAPATNDMIMAATVEAGGTLQVNNLGSDLHTGDTFKLFSVPVTGAFDVTNLPVTTGNGAITYVWTNKLAIDGTLQVLVGAPNVNTTPTNITSSLSGNVLTLAWPGDHIGWRLQSQTNTLGGGLNAAPAGWATVPGSSGVNSASFTIDPQQPTVFYRLVYP